MEKKETGEIAVNLEDYKNSMVNIVGDALTKEFSVQIGQMSMPEIMAWVEDNCTDEKIAEYKNLVTNTVLIEQQNELSRRFDRILSIGEIGDLFDITVSSEAAAIRNQIKNKTNSERNSTHNL